MASVQEPLAASIFGASVAQAAWKTKPSWYLVSEMDRIINPDLERFKAKRIEAREVVSLPASHASLVSHPNEVAKLIMDAANATATGCSIWAKSSWGHIESHLLRAQIYLKFPKIYPPERT